MSQESRQRLAAELANLLHQPSSSRATSYLHLLDSLLTQPSSKLPPEELQTSLSIYLEQAVFSDANSTGGHLVVGKQVLTDFEVALAKARRGSSSDRTSSDEPSILDDDVRKAVLQDALGKARERVLSFEEQISSIRQQLSDIYESEEDWLEAAKTLQGIPLDSGHRSVSDLYKLRIFVRIVRLLLEGDDAVGADTFLKRAALVIHNVPGATTGLASAAQPSSAASEEEKQEAKSLGLQYKLSQARVYDSQRRFAEAANRFHELSYVAEIDENDRNQMLAAAVTASILAPAGPQRSRILATLVRDERTASLPQHTILTRVFLDQIVRPAEIASFETLLAPHQRASLPKGFNEAATMASQEDMVEEKLDGEKGEGGGGRGKVGGLNRDGPSTVLDRAMMEHNILATSRLYSNITLSGLASLLDLSSIGAETMARRMIAQGRLKAEIDQVDGVVVFLGGESVTSAGGVATTQQERNEGDGGVGGGGGGEEDEYEDPDSAYTSRWDASIAKTASGVEDVFARLRAKALVPV